MHDNSNCFFLMDNVIQDYVWGSKTSINALFGIANPDNKHQAEMWMGTHANGCSKIEVAGKSVLLSDFINTDKIAILGASTTREFSQLPYLFKILAAEKALSIQVHPTKEQAEIGFAKEQAQNIALTASDRNYKDANHKPELIYALTSYQAMNGFRVFSEIINAFNEMDIDVLRPLLSYFQKHMNAQGLEHFFMGILALQGAPKEQAIIQLLAFHQAHPEATNAKLVLALAEQYQNDVGLFCPLILNVCTLQPGEAMFLNARTPHAYIQGTGLEIMANSDNVIRAGLTPKHMDLEELETCTRFEPIAFNDLLLAPERLDGACNYPIPVNDFKFSIYKNQAIRQLTMHSAEIILVLEGSLVLKQEGEQMLVIKQGDSVFIPAYTKQYSVQGTGSFARAYN
ncbi:mannose-6-phosphate isomerase [Psychromonas sp. PRT-SC03]|nr:mannose-6-phosphate isomerase [Psychromonas sp. PRT-SC03]